MKPQYIASFHNSPQVTFQKTGIKPYKTRRYALTRVLSRLIYAQHTKIHSKAILSEEFSPKFDLRAGETGCSREREMWKGLELWPTREKL